MKWYTYIICLILIVVGSFSGIQLFKEVKSESYVNGSIDISNKFSQESFYYSNSSCVFYHNLEDETDTYTFEKDLLKVDDFNGKEKQYKVSLNEYVLIDCEINAGSIFSTINIDFYNTDGDIICNSTMQISIVFLSNKTQLKLSTNGEESANFLEQYFSDFGIRIKVEEMI